MKATLSELHRETKKVLRPVIHAGKTVELTDRGEVCAKIIPMPKVDRDKALDDLIAMGPIKIAPRK